MDELDGGHVRDGGCCVEVKGRSTDWGTFGGGGVCRCCCCCGKADDERFLDPFEVIRYFFVFLHNFNIFTACLNLSAGLLLASPNSAPKM